MQNRMLMRVTFDAMAPWSGEASLLSPATHSKMAEPFWFGSGPDEVRPAASHPSLCPPVHPKLLQLWLGL
jgi:hypothetical protein